MLEETNIKHGHRQRLKERFSKSPIRTVADYEILEMLLFYIIPVRDTKPLAKLLLKKFGSLIGVVNAEPTQLAEIKGIGQSVVIYLKLLKDFFSRLHISNNLEKRYMF